MKKMFEDTKAEAVNRRRMRQYNSQKDKTRQKDEQ